MKRFLAIALSILLSALVLTSCTATTNKTITTTLPTTKEVIVTTTEKAKITVPDLTAYGLKYNYDSQKYETIDKRYGIETKNAGSFVEQVYLEGKKVGAFGFAPEVAKKILKDELAKIPDGKNKLKVIVPLDLTGLTSTGKCEVVSALVNEAKKDCLIVKFDEPLNIINVIPGKSEFITSTNGVNLTFNKDGKDSKVNNLGTIVPIVNFSNEKVSKENAMNHLAYLSSRESIPIGYTKKVSFGDAFGVEKVFSNLVITCDNRNTISLGISDLLFVDNSLVFISPNKSK